MGEMQSNPLPKPPKKETRKYEKNENFSVKVQEKGGGGRSSGGAKL